MKENIEEDIKRIKQRIEDVKEYLEYGLQYSEYLDLENSFEHILSDYKRVLKENEVLLKEKKELLQEKIDNQKINLLAQNSMLDYQKGYEDGKANRGSAVQSIIENQQYYIFQKQIEKYEEHIEKLQKENEELKAERELVGLPVRNKRDGKIGIILHKWKSGSIAVLENIRPRIINTHDSWNTLKIVADNVEQKKTEENYIPVQKVKDKIEKLKQLEFNSDLVTQSTANLTTICILQELIESEDKR